MTARKRKAPRKSQSRTSRKAKAKRVRSSRPVRSVRVSEARRLRRAVEELRAAVDRLITVLEGAGIGSSSRITRAPAGIAERAFGQLTVKQRFPFGLWHSTDTQQRWALDFRDNGCDWIERTAAGDTLRRHAELERSGSTWIVRRANDLEALTFLGATPQLCSQILASRPQPSFIRIDLDDDQFHGEWNGLRWTVDPKGQLQTLEQPGSTPSTISVFTFTYQTGSDEMWFRTDESYQLTFDQEGQEGSQFHSRWLQWPGGGSGVTLGRGHDMKERTAADVRSELVAAGVTAALADAFAAGAALSGDAARDFVRQRRDICGNITPAQQLRLFRADYAALEADTRRICRKADVVAKYGTVDFAKLDPRIWAVTVDLRFRGDYTPASRALLQKAIADNDLATFRKAISKASNWTGVPAARFNARVAALA